MLLYLCVCKCLIFLPSCKVTAQARAIYRIQGLTILQDHALRENEREAERDWLRELPVKDYKDILQMGVLSPQDFERHCPMLSCRRHSALSTSNWVAWPAYSYILLAHEVVHAGFSETCKKIFTHCEFPETAIFVQRLQIVASQQRKAQPELSNDPQLDLTLMAVNSFAQFNILQRCQMTGYDLSRERTAC